MTYADSLALRVLTACSTPQGSRPDAASQRLRRPRRPGGRSRPRRRVGRRPRVIAALSLSSPAPRLAEDPERPVARRASTPIDLSPPSGRAAAGPRPSADGRRHSSAPRAAPGRCCRAVRPGHHYARSRGLRSMAAPPRVATRRRCSSRERCPGRQRLHTDIRRRARARPRPEPRVHASERGRPRTSGLLAGLPRPRTAGSRPSPPSAPSSPAVLRPHLAQEFEPGQHLPRGPGERRAPALPLRTTPHLRRYLVDERLHVTREGGVDRAHRRHRSSV